MSLGPPESGIVSCERQGIERITDLTKRYRADGFSVLPPAGKQWCLMAQRRDFLAFSASKYVGTRVEKPPGVAEGGQAFAVGAFRIRVPGEDVSSPDALKRFHERWTADGSAAIETGSGFEARLTGTGDQAPIASEAEIDESFPTDCVRYRYVMEEKDHPRSRWPLVLQTEGVLCRHPDAPDSLIDVQFSERKRKGWVDPEPEYARRFRQEAEATLKSVEFLPILQN